MFRRYKERVDQKRSRTNSQASDREGYEEGEDRETDTGEDPQVQEAVNKDAMMSYSHYDKDMMARIRGKGHTVLINMYTYGRETEA